MGFDGVISESSVWGFDVCSFMRCVATVSSYIRRSYSYDDIEVILAIRCLEHLDAAWCFWTILAGSTEIGFVIRYSPLLRTPISI